MTDDETNPATPEPEANPASPLRVIGRVVRGGSDGMVPVLLEIEGEYGATRTTLAEFFKANPEFSGADRAAIRRACADGGAGFTGGGGAAVRWRIRRDPFRIVR